MAGTPLTSVGRCFTTWHHRDECALRLFLVPPDLRLLPKAAGGSGDAEGVPEAAVARLLPGLRVRWRLDEAAPAGHGGARDGSRGFESRWDFSSLSSLVKWECPPRTPGLRRPLSKASRRAGSSAAAPGAPGHQGAPASPQPATRASSGGPEGPLDTLAAAPEGSRGGLYLSTPVPQDPIRGGPRAPRWRSRPRLRPTPEEELRAAVLQLRETVVQQKETLGAQREAIRELTGKLARCEGLAGGKAPGRAATGKDTMGDLPRDPGHVVEQLSRSLQTLKDRLESLEHQLRVNVSNAALPSDFREVLQRRLGELERQLLRKVAELEDEKSLLHNETSAHRQKTESALNALLQRVTELERGNSAFKSPDAFKVSLPLRTNYLYGKIKKTLPELYAFTICLWLRSSASPGIGTPFSYAVPGQANEIVLIEWGNNPIELLINDKVAQLPLFVSDGKWHHICVTWTTRDGMWEAFQDGEKLGTGENLAPWHPIKPGGVLILGQEQDTVGGRFDATQAFVGELSQFNIWDRVLRAQEIVNIANCSTNMPGNIIPWVDNNVDVFGGASKWPVETCEERLLDL
ncbi:PREDICTED: neuronal pentraxin-2 [Ceratotherium simum simum]|uniref:Neuronal pentraxin-2 n=1 Tax=Ceratotherium simum simum TaxID=73337 RepID=A0ABM1DH04_CERSS|nr:PREDICTED: neuronal pentraxin-2 [Ceratotherium simum simum]